jgi:large repetitive protein
MTSYPKKINIFIYLFLFFIITLQGCSALNPASGSKNDNISANSLNGIKLIDEEMELAVGESYIVETEIDSDDYRWSTSRPDIAKVDRGLVTGLSAGISNVMVYKSNDPHNYSICKVTVIDEHERDPGSAHPVMTRLVMAQESKVVLADSNFKFECVGFDNFGQEVAVRPVWGVDGNIGSIDSGGYLKASGSGVGSVVATLGSFVVSCSVTVIDYVPQITNLELSPANVTLNLEAVCEFTCIVYDQYQNEMNAKLYWSTHGGIGELANGVFTAKSEGLGAVVVECGDERVEAVVAVVEEDLVVSALKIIPEDDVLLTEHSVQQFECLAYDQFGNEMDVDLEWPSVTNYVGGFSADYIFTPTRNGSVSLMVRYGAISDYRKITVVDTVVSDIKISPDIVSLTDIENQEFICEVTDQLGNRFFVTPNWTLVENYGVVSSNGTFTPFFGEVGMLTLRAEYRDAIAESHIVVERSGSIAQSLRVVIQTVKLVPGDLERIAFDVIDQYDDEMELDAVAEFSAETGTITSEGDYIPTTIGEDIITITVGNLTTQVAIEVVDSYFDDVQLESEVRSVLDIPSRRLLRSDLASLENLVAINSEITSIKGLEYCTSLKILDLRFNLLSRTAYDNITDLSPIAGLTLLEELYLDGNHIDNFGHISNLTSLKKLSLNRTYILDLTTLSSLTNLTHLSLADNGLVNLYGLEALSNLESLILNDELFSGDVAYYSPQEGVAIAVNHIENYSPLDNLENLTSINR